MANYRLTILPSGAGVPVRVESKDLDIDFRTIFIGADRLKFYQDGAGLTARLKLDGRFVAQTATASDELATWGQVQDLVVNELGQLEWQASVISRLETPPTSPATGDRHLIIATATGDWAGKEDQIAQWNGTAWDYTTVTLGTYLSVDAETGGIYYFGGSSWTMKSFERNTAGNGIAIDGSGVVSATAYRGIVVDANGVGADVGKGIELDATDSYKIAVKSDATGGAGLAKAIRVSANGVAVGVDGLSTTEDSSGNVVVKFHETRTAGAVLQQYDVVHFDKSTNKVTKAIANGTQADLDQDEIGIAMTGQAVDGDVDIVIRPGAVYTPTVQSGVNPRNGEPAYISRTQPGAVTNTLTGFVSGDIVRKIGTFYGTTSVRFFPETGWVY